MNCNNKIKYPNKNAALIALSEINSEYSEDRGIQTAYECKHHECWHTGHSKDYSELYKKSTGSYPQKCGALFDQEPTEYEKNLLINCGIISIWKETFEQFQSNEPIEDYNTQLRF